MWRVLVVLAVIGLLAIPVGPSFADDRPQLFSSPVGVAVDSAGNVYVADAEYRRIVKLSPTGELLAQWDSRGAERGQFRSPQSVAVDSAGSVYVVDSGSAGIVKLSPTGELLAEWNEAVDH